MPHRPLPHRPLPNFCHQRLRRHCRETRFGVLQEFCNKDATGLDINQRLLLLWSRQSRPHRHPKKRSAQPTDRHFQPQAENERNIVGVGPRALVST
jgi:hypothetical protein